MGVPVSHGMRDRALEVIGASLDYSILRPAKAPTRALMKIIVDSKKEKFDQTVEGVQEFMTAWLAVKSGPEQYVYRLYEDCVEEAGRRAFPTFANKDRDWWLMQHSAAKASFMAKANE